jgi:hypothetical protein
VKERPEFETTSHVFVETEPVIPEIAIYPNMQCQSLVIGQSK